VGRAVTTTAAPRLLLVDDEDAIRSSLAPYLQRSGFDVRTAADGAQALAVTDTWIPQIVVSDVLMPILDGRGLVRALRQRDDWTPVILLTQVGESYERSAALDEGADDYLNKPFDPAELVARIRAVLRRAVPGRRPLGSSDVLVSGGLRIERLARRTFVDDVEVYPTPKASLLLDYLVTHPDELHTREHLLRTLWGFEGAVSSRAVDHRVAELRRVLGDDATHPRYIETVQSLGYRFVGVVTTGGGAR